MKHQLSTCESVSSLEVQGEANDMGLVAQASVSPQQKTFSGCVSRFVERYAKEMPTALAVTCGSESLTYRELDDRAEALARQLNGIGVGVETVVGLYLPRSVASIVGALGILKAGGAYLPLDPADPQVRSGLMLDDAGVSVVVTAGNLADRVPGSNRTVIVLNAVGQLSESSIHGGSDARRRPAVGRNLAYVIYTSGSTGTPKGVEVTHDNLLNLVAWHGSAFQVTARDRASHLAKVGFDAGVWEVWPYLASGASLHVVDESALNDPEALQRWLMDQRITIAFVPTPMAERLLALSWPAHTTLRLMLTGGDALHTYPGPELPFQLINNYGPTECTVVATSGVVSSNIGSNSMPPIGRPITNTEIYILNELLQPVKSGTPGEIYIGGAGVTRGYRNRPDWTAERFVPNPIATNGGRVFKTGDIGQWLPDGQIAFLGRVDEQIKIRGFRIEPNEIVTALNQHAAVAHSAVIARESAPGDFRLVAYVVLNPEARLSSMELRNFLSERLPNYMLPATVVKLDAIPLTPNGKVDRAALPAPNESNTLREVVSRGPRTEVEQVVAGILSPLLGVEQIDVEANFFSLGGHSLLGTQLISRLRETLDVEVPLRTVFQAPSVVELAAEVERLLFAKIEAMSDEEVQRSLTGESPP